MADPTQDGRGRIVLGSRSPRRHELLSLLVGADRIRVCPSLDPTEADFHAVPSVEDITRRLTQIVQAKRDDVLAQLRSDGTLTTVAAVLTADTVIVGFDVQGQPVALGQPPDDERWAQVVREWFARYLLRAPHLALTAICCSTPNGEHLEQVVTTEVTFRSDAGKWLDWYIDTGEPRGKAGGYALQGVGSLFVESLEGSPSNVIGLPLRETGEMLQELGLLNEHDVQSGHR